MQSSMQLVEEEKVRGVVSMNEDFELRYWVPSAEEWNSNGVKFLQLETADIFHAPTPDKLKRGIDFIKQFEGTGDSVYVHCKAGRTRSATLVACYLMQKHGWDPKTAVDFMKSKRHHILLHSPQWNALTEFSSSQGNQEAAAPITAS
jgi:atypical dual specificity phosphatase